MSRRIAIVATAFIVGAAIAGHSFPSSAAVCQQINVWGLEECKCPLGKLPYLDVRQCFEDFDKFAHYPILDPDSVLKTIVNR